MAHDFYDVCLAMTMPLIEQNEREFNELLDAIEVLQIESILEIGVFRGGTLSRLSSRFPYATVIGIDPNPMIERWAPEWGDMHLIIGMSQDAETRRKALRHNEDRLFDVIWIDGDHMFEAVELDWYWAKDHARKMVAFHDIKDHNNDMIEVYRVWDQIHADERYNTREISHEGEVWGIGVVYL